MSDEPFNAPEQDEDSIQREASLNLHRSRLDAIADLKRNGKGLAYLYGRIRDKIENEKKIALRGSHFLTDRESARQRMLALESILEIVGLDERNAIEAVKDTGRGQ